MKKNLQELLDALGNRSITICRELTKKHETVFVPTLEEAIAHYTEVEPKGECVIVIEGVSFESLAKEEQKQWEQMSVPEHMEYYLQQGMSQKDAMKQVAKDRGVGKRDIYQVLLKEKQ